MANTARRFKLKTGVISSKTRKLKTRKLKTGGDKDDPLLAPFKKLHLKLGAKIFSDNYYNNASTEFFIINDTPSTHVKPPIFVKFARFIGIKPDANKMTKSNYDTMYYFLRMVLYLSAHKYFKTYDRDYQHKPRDPDFWINIMKLISENQLLKTDLTTKLEIVRDKLKHDNLGNAAEEKAAEENSAQRIQKLVRGNIGRENAAKVKAAKEKAAKEKAAKVNDVKVNDTKVNDTKVMDAKVMDAKVMDAKVKAKPSSVVEEKAKPVGNERTVDKNTLKEAAAVTAKAKDAAADSQKMFKAAEEKAAEEKAAKEKAAEEKAAEEKVAEEKAAEEKAAEEKAAEETTRKHEESINKNRNEITNRSSNPPTNTGITNVLAGLHEQFDVLGRKFDNNNDKQKGIQDLLTEKTALLKAIHAADRTIERLRSTLTEKTSTDGLEDGWTTILVRKGEQGNDIYEAKFAKKVEVDKKVEADKNAGLFPPANPVTPVSTTPEPLPPMPRASPTNSHRSQNVAVPKNVDANKTSDVANKPGLFPPPPQRRQNVAVAVPKVPVPKVPVPKVPVQKLPIEADV